VNAIPERLELGFLEVGIQVIALRLTIILRQRDLAIAEYRINELEYSLRIGR
jgi:hypothetical protein